MIYHIFMLSVIGICLWLGVSLLMNKKYKYGVSIIIASLAAIGGYSFLNNLTIEINNNKQEIYGMRTTFRQTMALQQNITNTVNLVTETRKEIANLNDAVKQIYEQGKMEVFRKEDIGKRVMVFSRVGKGSILYFQLEFIPIPNSVFLSSNTGMISPVTLDVYKNIVAFRTNEEPKAVLDSPEEFYCINYSQDYSPNPDLKTVVGMEYKGTPEFINAAIFQPLKK